MIATINEEPSIANSEKTKAAPVKSKVAPSKKSAAPRKKPVARKTRPAPRKRKAAASETQTPSERILSLITSILDDGKALDVVVIDLAGKSTMADCMVVASGGSTRQLNALAERLIRGLKTAKYGTPAVEGLTQGDWVLIDAGDVIVHLFRPEIRNLYNLEKMWEVALPDDGHNVVFGG